MRDFYRSQDRSLEDETAKAMLRLINLVQHGEPSEAIDAAKVVLPLLIHKEPDAPLVEIDMRETAPGPEVPKDAGQIGDFIEKLHRIGEDLGLPGMGGAAARIEVQDEPGDEEP